MFDEIMREREEFDVDKIIDSKKEYFKNHVLTIIHEADKVKRYQFRQPDTGCYGFSLTCADNLIVMNGDCYTLIVEPGYGRCGLAFLRGSIESYDYFLGKAPFHGKDIYTEYSYDQACDNLKYEFENGYITEDDFEYLYGLDEGDFYGMFKYYEFCYDKEVEEPSSPRRLSNTTMLQLAGLMCFVEAYEKEFGE